MKRLILLFVIAVLGMAVHAQRQYKTFSNDSIQGDTSLFVSNVKVAKYSNTVVAFNFTKADVTDSLNYAKLQGSMDNSIFIDLDDATASLDETTTDGTTTLYVTTPIYLFYRALLSCASGDTVAVTNPAFIIKED